MTITFYDLAGADERVRFSPYCWRVKFALRHKDIEAREVPVRFTDKEAIAFSGQELVPVLTDGAKVVSDSWEIAEYLEAAYPDRPSLFGGVAAQSQAMFLKFWCEQTLHPLLLRLMILGVFGNIHVKDKAHFRKTREERFGCSLEQIAVPPEKGIPRVREALAPLRALLQRQPYIAGEAPMFVDYMVISHFVFARVVSSLHLIEHEDPIHAWHERMFDAFEGLARRAVRGGPVVRSLPSATTG
jgi:glutathione S-transferase